MTGEGRRPDGTERGPEAAGAAGGTATSTTRDVFGGHPLGFLRRVSCLKRWRSSGVRVKRLKGGGVTRGAVWIQLEEGITAD